VIPITLTLRGCDDETVLDLEVTDDVLEALVIIAIHSEDQSEGACMPTMSVESRKEKP